MNAKILSKKKLDNKLQHYIDNKNDVAVVVYALLKKDPTPLKMDIEAAAQSGLKTLFLDSIKRDILDNVDMVVLPLSSADERNNVIYQYDIEIPAELTTLNGDLGRPNVQEFDFKIHSLDDIKVLLICIGNADGNIVLYKKMAPVNIFSRDGFFLMKSDTRLKEIKEGFFRVSDNFQIIKVNGNIFVMDLNLIEKMFGFHEVIKKEALAGVDAIKKMNIVSNIEVVSELVDDVKYARKLTKVAKASPVIQAGVNNASIIEFCKTYPSLKKRIRFNADETMISLDTKVSKNLFIKVLMDDFLTSQLTQFYYDSIAKDTVINIIEEAAAG